MDPSQFLNSKISIILALWWKFGVVLTVFAHFRAVLVIFRFLTLLYMGGGLYLPYQSYFICALPSRLRCGKILKSMWTNYASEDSVIFLEVMTVSSRRYHQNRGISLYLLIKNWKITKTALKWAKTVKTSPNFHQRTKIIRIFEFQNFFGRGPFLRILGQFFQFCHLFWKTQK